MPHRRIPGEDELTFESGYGGARTVVVKEVRMPCPVRVAKYVEPQPEASEAPVVQTPVSGTGGVVTAPSNRVCLSGRHFTIHVIQIKGLVYRQVSVWVNGHRVHVARGLRISAPVDLRGLPKGRYTVRITVSTSTGRRITGTRSYHTCAPKPLPGGRSRL